MFEKLFKKTTAKAEEAIETVVDDTKQVMTNANKLIGTSKDKIEILSYIFVLGLGLNMLANVVTLVCCARVIKSVNRNDVLNDIAKMLRNK